MKRDYKNPRRVNCYGKLIVQGLTYWLLKLEPITGDSWENDSCMRFLAVPSEIMGFKDGGYEHEIFDYPRHVVINGDFILEILEDHTILVPSEKEDEEEIATGITEEVESLQSIIEEPLPF
jgi:hypothetical protein